MIQRLLHNSFLRSSFVFTAANMLVSVIAYIDNLLVARNLTLSEYGEYTTALSYLIFFGVPLTAFGLIVIERIGRAKAAEREGVALSIELWLEKELWRLSPFLLVLASVLSLTMYFRGNMSLVAVVFVMVSSFLGVFINFYTSVLQSYKSFWSVGIFTTIGALIKLILYIMVIIFVPRLSWLFFVFMLSMLVSWILGRRMIRKRKDVKLPKIQFAQVRKYIQRKSILVPLFTTLGIVGLSNVDVVLVKKFFDNDIVGLYSSLSVLGKIIFYASTPISAVAFTFFTGSDTKHQSLRILVLLTVLISLLGFGSTTVYALFPRLVIDFFFGSKFLAVSNLVWLSALFGTVYSLMYLYAQYFVAKHSRFAIMGILAVVLQIVTIYIVHNSLFDILVINIIVNSGLLLIYMGAVVRSELLHLK